ncbi:hypothetical protein Tco_0482114, partial [Tanacetum coccineum]
GAEASNESAFKNDDDGVSGCALKPIITEGKKNNVGFCQNVVHGSGQNPSNGVSTHNSRSFIYSGFILCNNEIKIMQLERTSGAICKCNTHSDIYCGLMLCNNEIKIVHSERAIGGIVFKSIDGEIINKASTVRAPIRIGYRTSPFVHHRSMCLEVGTLYLGEPPRFLQLYIYDTENEVKNKMHHFSRENGSGLKREIVKGLIKFSNEYNELVKLFETTRYKCGETDLANFRNKLYSVVGTQEYELPSSETLGAIVFESGPAGYETDYDVVIQEKNGMLQRINNFHPAYMSLQFPLLFVFGEAGFNPKMKLVGVSGTTPNK